MTKYTKSFAESLKEVREPKVVNEFKKMTVSFKSHDDMAKASTDLAKQGFTITGNKDALKLNAMVKDPHKSKEDKPMKDMNAMYMKSNVKAPVMNKGGADMASVKDAPDMKDAMKKINATYGMKKENNGRYLQTKPGSLEEAVLKSRGLVK